MPDFYSDSRATASVFAVNRGIENEQTHMRMIGLEIPFSSIGPDTGSSPDCLFLVSRSRLAFPARFALWFDLLADERNTAVRIHTVALECLAFALAGSLSIERRQTQRWRHLLTLFLAFVSHVLLPWVSATYCLHFRKKSVIQNA